MEKLKQRYKQTDIGVIPEDWNIVTIEEIIREISMGPFGSDIKVSNFVSEGIPVLNGYSVSDKYLKDDFSNFVTPEKAKSLKKAVAKRGDVVVTHRGTIGQISYIPSNSLYKSYVISQSQFRVTFDKLKVIPSYVVLYFHSEKGQSTIQESKGHTGVPAIAQPTTTFRKFIIPLPFLAEQIAIVNTLSDVDNLIAAMDKKITKKQHIKQGVMQQLLTGKNRLPGFSGEWAEKSFKDVCWFQEGPGLRNWQFTNSGIKVINVTNLENGFLNLNRTDRYISLDEFHKMYEHFEIDENDIVVASSGNSYGKTSKVRKQDLPLLMNTSVIRFKPMGDLDYNFLWIFLNSLDFKSQIDLLITGGAQPNFGPAHLNKLNIFLPLNKTEQTAIAQILTDMDDEITQLEADRNKYEQIKAGMMQQLLTGKIRLTGGVQTTIIPEQTKTVELNSKKQTHTDQINEAVVISFLVNKFSSVQYPLSRFRYTKYTYLLHRQYEHVAYGFKKHAAGPYKPENRYKGPEIIAIKNKYITKVENSKSGKDAFITNANIAQALNYFNEWYSSEIQEWIEQFRFYKNDDLEVLTTVDESICDLNCKGTDIFVTTIKNYIASIPQWKHKLTKSCFSDLNIERMIRKSNELFSQ